MFLSFNFVKQYVKLPEITPKELGLALTLSTVEVENVIDQSENLEGIVVGRVLEVVKHPQADRLSVCRVDIKSEELQIICGGSNVVKGMYVAVAKVGSKVKWHGKGEPIVLEKAKIRGIESSGMIASSEEIGLAALFPQKDEREILDLSPYQVRVGDPLAKALGLTDVIFEIDNKSMTHRPDLWGQYGLAREVAAIYNTKLKPLKIAPVPGVTGAAMQLSVSVKDYDLCPRYAAIVLDNVTAVQSPWWLKRDLEEVGINSINAIVDITNYVMITLGQPLHAFDYNALEGQTIVVEQAGGGLTYDVLNGKQYQVPAETLMIKDGAKPIAIAGIIGGANSHIADQTRTIVLEAANFNAASVRRSSLALGLRTEASSRFEKKLDPELVPQALALAVELILQLVPGSQVASRLIEKRSEPQAPPAVQLAKSFLDKRLGKELDPKEVVSILKRLEFGASFKRGLYAISVPSFRARDVLTPEDVVEEIARIHGYNSIEPAMPVVTVSQPTRTMASRVEHEVKTILTRGFGYSELYNYSFAEPKWSEALGMTRNRVAVANALTPEQMYMRSSLLPGLMARVMDNARWYQSFKLFEMGRVFAKTPGEFSLDGTNQAFLPSQSRKLAGMLVGHKNDVEQLYAQAKGEIRELLRQLNMSAEFKEATLPFATACFDVRAHTTSIGSIGIMRQELTADLKNKAVVWWTLHFEPLVKFADFSRTYQPIAKFPSIVRDIALLVDASVPWGDIEKSLQHISPLVKQIELFDIFASPKLGEHKKSVAFSMTFASDDRTLESGEVDAVIAKVLKLLQDKFDAVPR